MQNKSKKIFLSCLIVGFLFLFFLPLFNVWASDSWSEMFDTSRACPCAPQNTPEKQYVRMQLNIPGITKSCPYPKTVYGNNKIGTQMVNCYYTEANLPDFIRKVYNFSIGIIAIFAVMVTMIGGLRWILAGGNPGQIKSAQDSIKAAVSGLVLVLLSYTILNLINPKLTNLELTQPSQLKTIEQSTDWCKDLAKVSGGVAPRIREVVSEGQTGTSYMAGKWFSDVGSTMCGVKYEIENSKKDANGYFQTCWGDGGCGDKQFCYQYADGTRPFCYDATTLCQQQNDKKNETEKSTDGNRLAQRTSGCDVADEVLRDQGSKYVCGKKINSVSVLGVVASIIPGFDYFTGYKGTLWAASDECILGEELKCPNGYERTSCLNSYECSFKVESGALYPRGCNLSSNGVIRGLEYWYKDNEKVCIDEPSRGANGVNAICCKKIDSSIAGDPYECVD